MVYRYNLLLRNGNKSLIIFSLCTEIRFFAEPVISQHLLLVFALMLILISNSPTEKNWNCLLWPHYGFTFFPFSFFFLKSFRKHQTHSFFFQLEKNVDTQGEGFPDVVELFKTHHLFHTRKSVNTVKP